MKIYNLLGLIILSSLVILSSGCKKEGGIALNFSAVYGDEPLVMLTNYPYTNGDEINFSVADFFVTDVYVTDDQGNNVELLDVEFIDFDAQNVNAELAMTPISLEIGSIDPGDYTSITFSIGLDQQVNSTRPEEYNPESPLSFSSRYWSAWDSYIFARFQGNLVNPAQGDDVPWLFHTGKDDVYRTFTYPLDKSVNENIANINITIDHQELFKVEDGYMDIRSKPTNHDPQDLEPLITITDNFATAVSID